MIASNKAVVTLDYVMYTDGSESTGTMRFIMGTGSAFPALERALEGRVVGEELEVTIQPDEAYGKRKGDEAHKLPRTLFPSEVELELGMQLVGQDLTGEQRPVWVVDLSEEEVTLDFEHPLAGATLVIKGTITELRPATEQELKEGAVT